MYLIKVGHLFTNNLNFSKKNYGIVKLGSGNAIHI
jgi:hypothetical protein